MIGRTILKASVNAEAAAAIFVLLINAVKATSSLFIVRTKDRLKVVKKVERKYSVYEKDEQRIEHVAEQGGSRLNLVEIPAGFPKENTPNAHEGKNVTLYYAES